MTWPVNSPVGKESRLFYCFLSHGRNRGLVKTFGQQHITGRDQFAVEVVEFCPLVKRRQGYKPIVVAGQAADLFRLPAVSLVIIIPEPAFHGNPAQGKTFITAENVQADTAIPVMPADIIE